MKFVALVSGGKDSVYSIVLAQKYGGHELVACVHLAKPQQQQQLADEEEEEESFMYQTAASEAVRTQVEECMCVPLISLTRTGTSRNTSLVYDTEEQEEASGDEVEDLYRALKLAQERFPEVQAVSSGAILSTYQRIRIEQVCGRLNLQPLAYLWRGAQQDLLDEMVEGLGLDAVLVKTAAPPGLQPHTHLNKRLRELLPHLRRLHERYQFHVCGEGGEYESLVLDCPGLFRRRLVLDEVEIVTDDDDDGIGVLVIKSCHAEDKPGCEATDTSNDPSPNLTLRALAVHAPVARPATNDDGPRRITVRPHCKMASGGLWSISALWCQRNVETVVDEAKEVFRTLQSALHEHECTARDVVFVHLYLNQMSDFGLVNAHYRDFFGVVLPPSRSTVAVSCLPGNRKIMLDCIVQCGSGDYLRSRSGTSNPYALEALTVPHSRLRRVLHVQSISRWAPVCVGPYSQANTIRDALHLVAGQIGLVPATMTLQPTWSKQLQQAWVNLSNVLDGIDGTELKNMLSCVIYVSDELHFTEVNKAIRASFDTVACNGGITPGLVDGTATKQDEYEDEGTRLELETDESRPRDLCPLLAVSIAQMPVGALIEIEATVATKKAASCLAITTTPLEISLLETSTALTLNQFVWDSGREFAHLSMPIVEQVKIVSSTRTMGHRRSVATSIIVASMPRDCSTVDLRPTIVHMMGRLHELSKDWLHVRAYFLEDFDDTCIRTVIEAAALAKLPFVAITSVPVSNLSLMVDCDNEQCFQDDDLQFIALQGLTIDPLQIEDDLWINNR